MSTHCLILLALLWTLCVDATHSAEPSRDKQESTELSRAEDTILKTEVDNIAHLGTPRDLDALYGIVTLSQTHQFGEKSAEILSVVTRKIATIPGHADFIGDDIEKLTTQPDTDRLRDKLMFMVSSVHSGDVLDLLGKFLFDSREPIQEAPEDDGSTYLRNDVLAAEGISRILGAQSPIRGTHLGFYNTREVSILQKWWNSPEGVQVRNEVGRRAAAFDPKAGLGNSIVLVDKKTPTVPARPNEKRWVPWLLAIGMVTEVQPIFGPRNGLVV